MVTGANAGIGKETALALAHMDATVVMVCRNPERGKVAQSDIQSQTGNDAVHLLLADFSVQQQIRQLASNFKTQFDRLDVLVNNAGLIMGQRIETVDGIETTFAINHLGYFLLTHELLDILRASAPARIVNVASGAHNIGPMPFEQLQGHHGYKAMRAYGASKLANIMFTYALARRLANTEITVNCLHPGVVATHFGSEGPFLIRHFFSLAKPFLRSSAKGAETSIYLASSPEVADVTGKYFIKKKATASSTSSYDENAWDRLWALSEQLTRLSF